MRKTREILRMRLGEGRSGRAVARSLGVSPSTVTECLLRAKLAGLTWPLPEEVDDEGLEGLLYPPPEPSQHYTQPDFRFIHKEMRRKHVTLMLLWEEYKRANPDGYQYSQFCEHYRRWRQKLDVSMRQVHRAGEKLFIDYAGATVDIIDPDSSEVMRAAIFVACMGASGYIYAEAQPGQDARSWVSGHMRAFEALGGVPEVLVPDNLKAGVTKACFYEPDLNPAYRDMAQHYGAAVIPARVRRPKDKAKVENAVLQVERWVLAPLRDETFTSIGQLNRAIKKRLEWLNDRPLSQLDNTRRGLFQELDQPALLPLPTQRYEVTEWKTGVLVGVDHHVPFDGHHYSVPHTLVRQRVDVRATWSTVELLYKGRRVAAHPRSDAKGQHTTVEAHRPKSHQRVAIDPNRLIALARKVGPSTEELVLAVLESKPHPEQGFRSALGVLRLAKAYEPERLEAACERAMALKAPSRTTVQSILKNGLDRLPLTEDTSAALEIDHDNIRGPEYYN